MVMYCPYCDIEINEAQLEAEDGCCPECGSVISTRSMLMGDDDDLDMEEDFDIYGDLDDEDDDDAYLDDDLDDSIFDDDDFDDFDDFDDDRD